MIKDLRVEPLPPTEKNTCETCKSMLPAKSRGIKIKSGKGKGQIGYWMCKNPLCRHYLEGRVAEDGKRCPYYEDKYENEETVDEWVANCHKKEVIRRNMYVDKERKSFSKFKQYSRVE